MRYEQYEQQDEERRGDAVPNASDLAYPKIGRPGEWSKASLSGLLSLAAAPTFAIMAIVAERQESGMPAMLCSAAHASALTGMVPMYLLMSAFHSGPWLRLAGSRRRGVHLA